MDYQFELPNELLAKSPVEPRDSARLFVSDTKTGAETFDTFLNLAAYIPEGSLLILNNTKVVPARVIAKKETGGKVELLFLMNEYRGGELVPVITDRKLEVGKKIRIADYKFGIERQEENRFFLKPQFSAGELNAVLEKYGTTPIPRYIGETGLGEQELRTRYQAIFAENTGSIAAPTASLHFTDRVFKKLTEKNIETIYVTLHVGLGTFATVTEENIRNKKLHKEYFEISQSTAEKIARAKKDGRMVVSVGTTTTRVLESASDRILKGQAVSDSTTLFIQPGFQFKIVDALTTNFHIPGSSLMYLVDAFLQYKGAHKRILDLYKKAIENKFRFYSFGDSMLVR